MAGLVRIPFTPDALAMYNPSANTTFTAMTPQQTTVYTATPLPRTFKPYRDTKIYFTVGLPTGIIASSVQISGSALGRYTATYSLYNETSSTITPLAQQVIIWQPS